MPRNRNQHKYEHRRYPHRMYHSNPRGQSSGSYEYNHRYAKRDHKLHRSRSYESNDHNTRKQRQHDVHSEHVHRYGQRQFYDSGYLSDNHRYHRHQHQYKHTGDENDHYLWKRKGKTEANQTRHYSLNRPNKKRKIIDISTEYNRKYKLVAYDNNNNHSHYDYESNTRSQGRHSDLYYINNRTENEYYWRRNRYDLKYNDFNNHNNKNYDRNTNNLYRNAGNRNNRNVYRNNNYAKLSNLRMSPQYDSEGNQMISMAEYQIRNNKYYERKKDEEQHHEQDISCSSSSCSSSSSASSSSSSSSTHEEEEEECEEEIAYKYEHDLDEKPLKLVCSNENTSDSWIVILDDKNRRCYSGYKANPFDTKELDSWWELMTDINGDIEWHRPQLPNGKPLPRKAAWLVSNECRCCYRYSATKWKPIVFPDWFNKLTERVLTETGLSFEYGPNSCNINWYENGKDSVGWHSDDEPLFQSKYQDTLILSLSLGQSRKFEIKLAEEEDETVNIKQVILHNGDLMSMEGLFQKYYQHRVPKSYDIVKPRINLTWRWITKHYFYRDNCPLYTHQGPGKMILLNE